MAADRVIVRVTARNAIRSGTLWGSVYGLLVYASAVGYAATFRTEFSRRTLARSFGRNPGIAALIGPARHLDTVDGFTAWRTLGVLSIVGAIWGVLAATRLMRGEEEGGRWELLLAGATTRGDAALQAVAGLGAGLFALWSVTASFALLAGASPKARFPVTGSLFLSVALVASAAVFLAVGALVSQLAPTRRQANAIGGAIVGAAYLIRMVADASAGLRWMRWASPLGWVETLHPFTGSRPLGLLPAVLLTVATAGTAVALAARRDLGAATLANRDESEPRLALLGGPVALTARLSRTALIGWTIALAAMGLVFGLVAQSAATAVSGSSTIEDILTRLGGKTSGAANYLGLTFAFAGALVAFAGAGQISSAREEEADGHVDNLLVRPVSRSRWFAGRMGMATVIVVVASVVAGFTSWIGAATQHTGIAIGDLLQAGINVAAPAVFIVGFGALCLGVVPRRAPAITFAVVIWGFLVQIVASITITNRWLLDTSVFNHITPAPAAPPNWGSVAWLCALGVAGMAAGVVAFNRRDLVSA